MDEIDRAALLPGEEDALRQEKAVQANAGRLAALTAEAYTLLYDDGDAVLPRLNRNARMTICGLIAHYDEADGASALRLFATCWLSQV